jgi:hypothetical protein
MNEEFKKDLKALLQKYDVSCGVNYYEFAGELFPDGIIFESTDAKEVLFFIEANSFDAEDIKLEEE